MQNYLCKMQRGFTLVELMVALAIIGILAAIALPSYEQYVIRGNRVAAQAEMLDIASRQQQFLLADREYADIGKLNASGYALSAEVSDKYTLSIDTNNAATPPIFTVTMTPKGSQTDDGALTLNSAGVKSPASKW
jgi:type IV pilus assembly protein PilE